MRPRIKKNKDIKHWTKVYKIIRNDKKINKGIYKKVVTN